MRTIRFQFLHQANGRTPRVFDELIEKLVLWFQNYIDLQVEEVWKTGFMIERDHKENPIFTLDKLKSETLAD